MGSLPSFHHQERSYSKLKNHSYNKMEKKDIHSYHSIEHPSIPNIVKITKFNCLGKIMIRSMKLTRIGLRNVQGVRFTTKAILHSYKGKNDYSTSIFITTCNTLSCTIHITQMVKSIICHKSSLQINAEQPEQQSQFLP